MPGNDYMHPLLVSGPTLSYEQSITLNLGDYNSTKITMGFYNVSADNVEADVEALRKAVPIVVSAVDEDHAQILSEAFGQAKADDLHAEVLSMFVKALEAKGKK